MKGNNNKTQNIQNIIKQTDTRSVLVFNKKEELFDSPFNSLSKLSTTKNQKTKKKKHPKFCIKKCDSLRINKCQCINSQKTLNA